MPESKTKAKSLMLKRISLTLFFCLFLTYAFAADSAQFISQSVPSTMSAGQSYTISLTFKNTGTSNWTKAANYKLGSQNSQDNTTWGVWAGFYS